ncbi:MAG: hypothetical protein KJ645_01905 [Planctomycetes bacterium]|nr:hypothetical protein [Planctomycetota bacterium]
MWCILCRWKISNALDGDHRLFSDRLWKHIHTCPACRTFYARISVVHENLRRATPAPALQTNESFTRIFWNTKFVAQDGSNPFARQRIRPVGRPLRLAAAASIGFVLMFFVFFSAPFSPDPSSIRPADLSATLEAVKEIPGLLFSSDVAELYQDDWIRPLTIEMDNLCKDAEAMQNFFKSIIPLGKIASKMH